MSPVVIAPLGALVIIGLIFVVRALLDNKRGSSPQGGQGGRVLEGAAASSGRSPALPGKRSTQRAAAVSSDGRRVRLLVHSINNDRCTGCDACVLVCPTDVLELFNNKSRVARFEDCIQCEKCAHVCPTSALVMHYEGTEPPPVLVPDLDDFFQTRTVPGLYLLGEVAGKPLVKNAVNLGRAAVEHALRSGLQSPGAQGAQGAQGPGGELRVDVIIVGSGPAGLSAAMSCIQRGLSYVVLEKDAIVASTIARYPKGKKVMAEPYDVRCVGLLPVWDSSKDQTIAEWNRLLSQVNLEIRLREAVEEIRAEGASFAVRTDKARYRGQRVLLCVGTRGKPRRLGVPGEELPEVMPLLDDPDLYRGQTLLVVGGGDSAVEAAVALAEPGLRNRVVLSYRGKQFNRVKAKNRQALEEAVAQQRVLVLLGSTVRSFAPRQALLNLADGRQKPIPAEHSFVLIGGDPPVKWLEQIGVRYVEKPHDFSTGRTDALVEQLIGRQMENNRPGMALPFPVAASAAMPALAGLGEDNEATVMQDQEALMASLRAQGKLPPLPSLGAPVRASERRANVTIMVPKDQFLLHLPEKMQVDASAARVSSLRRE